MHTPRSSKRRATRMHTSSTAPNEHMAICWRTSLRPSPASSSAGFSILEQPLHLELSGSCPGSCTRTDTLRAISRMGKAERWDRHFGWHNLDWLECVLPGLCNYCKGSRRSGADEQSKTAHGGGCGMEAPASWGGWLTTGNIRGFIHARGGRQAAAAARCGKRIVHGSSQLVM